MEKEFFPSRGDSLPLADYASRMEQVPDGGDCGCGGGHGQADGHHQDCHNHGGHSHGHSGCHHAPSGSCGCLTPTEPPCGGCVGHEGCGADSWGLFEYPLAMVYAPCQVYRGLYDPDTALHRGTLFTELDLPLGEDRGGLTAMACAGRKERSQQ